MIATMDTTVSLRFKDAQAKLEFCQKLRERDPSTEEEKRDGALSYSEQVAQDISDYAGLVVPCSGKDECELVADVSLGVFGVSVVW